MAESTIITGQFVRINQTSASIGDRLLALVIDYLLILFYVVSISLLLRAFHVHASSSVSFFFLFFLFYLPALCYSLLCEVFNQGQSLGKALFHIRVVKVDGSTPSLSAYLLRWLLFVVDGPITSGLGLLIILLTKNRQRLGDLAAGTMVIKELDYRKIQVSLDEYDFLTKGYHPVYPQAVDLSLEQVNVITKTLAAAKIDRLKHIRLLAGKVRSLLAINGAEMGDELFLQTLLRDYQFYALEEI